LIITVVLSSLYGSSDEWHQTFIFGRNGQLADVLVDLSGALLVLIVFRRRCLRKNE
jgi:VanZ family protein